MEENKKTKEKKTEGKKLTAIIRISGQVKVNYNIANTLERLKLKRKYSCILINSNNKSMKGMLDKVRYYVAYGEISKETLIRLLRARAKKLDKKEFKTEETAEKLLSGKTLKELGFIPFLRLHPPRKGIKSKLQYPKGVLGNNKKDIDKLIERML